MRCEERGRGRARCGWEWSLLGPPKAEILGSGTPGTAALPHVLCRWWCWEATGKRRTGGLVPHFRTNTAYLAGTKSGDWLCRTLMLIGCQFSRLQEQTGAQTHRPVAAGQVGLRFWHHQDPCSYPEFERPALSRFERQWSEQWRQLISRMMASHSMREAFLDCHVGVSVG